jgi:hypothetical protein
MGAMPALGISWKIGNPFIYGPLRRLISGMIGK